MCNLTTLKASPDGYVARCEKCNLLHVAYGNTITTYSRSGFYDLISVADDLFNRHNLHPFRDEKMIRMPTASRSVTLVFSVNELRAFLHLLIQGRNKMEYDRLLEVSKN